MLMCVCVCTCQFDDSSDPVDLHVQSAVSVEDFHSDSFTNVLPQFPHRHLNKNKSETSRDVGGEPVTPPVTW